MKKKGQLFKLLASILLFIGLFSLSVFAADPGHSAGVIAANDFASGNYSFPDSFIFDGENHGV